jgi:hypothetical protein
MLCFFKKLDVKSNQTRIQFQLTSIIPFSVFWISEAGTNRLSWNVGKELPLYSVLYPNTAGISHDDLVMQALVWLHMVQLGFYMRMYDELP